MREQDLIKDTYATKDLHLVAFLQIKGMVVKKLEQYGRGQGRQNPVYFIFSDSKRCQELENVFWNGVGDEVMVNAKDYFTTIRDLRARIFSIMRLVKKEEDSF